jgi:hypothetical protein
VADNVTVPLTGSGDATAVIATDDAGASGQVQVIKLAEGTNGSAVALPATAANGLTVDVTRVVAGTGPTHLGKAEDAVHASGDTGVMALAVRNDAGTTLVSATGDYSPLSTDANGALRVTGASGATEYVEDAVATANPQGPQVIARRRDTLTVAEVSADGDVIAVNASSKGQLHVRSEADILSAPAASRTTDSIGSAAQTDAVMNGLTALTPKFAQINRATNADGAAVVSAVAAKKIRVLRLSFVCAGAVGAKWQSATSNTSGAGIDTDLCPVMSFAANGGISDAYCPLGLFETASGEGLKLNLNAAVQVSGYLTYVEV